MIYLIYLHIRRVINIQMISKTYIHKDRKKGNKITTKQTIKANNKNKEINFCYICIYIYIYKYDLIYIFKYKYE